MRLDPISFAPHSAPASRPERVGRSQVGRAEVVAEVAPIAEAADGGDAWRLPLPARRALVLPQPETPHRVADTLVAIRRYTAGGLAPTPFPAGSLVRIAI